MAKIKTKERILMSRFEPTLTYHALVRISERLAPKTKKQANIIVGNYRIAGEFEAGWVKPSLITHVLADVRGSIYGQTYYNPHKGLITEGKLAWYVLGTYGEVITVMTTLEKEYRAEMVNVDFRFRVMYLRLDKHLNPNYDPNDPTDFRTWRNGKEKLKLPYYK